MTTESEPGTAAALLEAGRVLFAERGYEGASVRAITAHACANLGAITYHFGSKRDLYDRVVEG
jgi:AcrR family transcriptional regulator